MLWLMKRLDEVGHGTTAKQYQAEWEQAQRVSGQVTSQRKL